MQHYGIMAIYIYKVDEIQRPHRSIRSSVELSVSWLLAIILLETFIYKLMFSMFV